jgi:recombination protein RecR
MYPKTIQKLIDLFSKFPTVGPRTASRFVFYLLRLPKEESEELVSAISKLKNSVKICQSCFKAFENGDKSCEICSNPSRDKSLLCLVANETDLTAIEKTKKYNGLYFILGGQVSALKKTDLERLRIKELEEIIKNRPEIREVILAFNANSEGEATALYLERFLKSFNKKITRLGRGLPTGGELEYADEETLKAAFEGRK